MNNYYAVLFVSIIITLMTATIITNWPASISFNCRGKDWSNLSFSSQGAETMIHYQLQRKSTLSFTPKRKGRGRDCKNCKEIPFTVVKKRPENTNVIDRRNEHRVFHWPFSSPGPSCCFRVLHVSSCRWGNLSQRWIETQIRKQMCNAIWWLWSLWIQLN